MYKHCYECRFARADVQIPIHTHNGGRLTWAKRYKWGKLLTALGLEHQPGVRNIDIPTAPGAFALMNVIRNLVERLEIPDSLDLAQVNRLLAMPDAFQDSVEKLLSNELWREIWDIGPKRCCKNELDINRTGDYERYKKAQVAAAVQRLIDIQQHSLLDTCSCR